MIGDVDQTLVSPSGEYVYFGGEGGPRRKSEKASEGITSVTDGQSSEAR